MNSRMVSTGRPVVGFDPRPGRREQSFYPPSERRADRELIARSLMLIWESRRLLAELDNRFGSAAALRERRIASHWDSE
jgi:hypothetical protein